MTLLANRIKETGSGGLGAITLSGAVSTFRAFPDGTQNYTILASTGEWEVGEGIVSGGALTRSTIYENHLGTQAAVDFTAKSIQIASTVTIQEFAQFVSASKFGEYTPFWNGMTDSSLDITITSNGTVVTLAVEKAGGGDFKVLLNNIEYTVDATPAQTIALTAGSDTSPTENYVWYQDNAGTPTLTVGTSGWPGLQHAKIATIVVQSAADVQTDGVYKMHAWSDHNANHIQHINFWIRSQPATWLSGVGLTLTQDTGPNPDSITVATAAGQMLQLHEHAVPAFDTAVSDNIHVVNDFTTPYTEVTNLNQILTDAVGNSLQSNNIRFSFVLWAVASEDPGDSKLFLNVPNGVYTNDSDAIADVDKQTVYSIPTIYRGSAFLIARLTYRYNSTGGSYTLIDNTDLRGVTPGVAGGAAGSGSTTFVDNTFTVENVLDTTKKIAMDAGSITAGNTRTITMADQDINLTPGIDFAKVNTFYTDQQAFRGNIPHDVYNWASPTVTNVKAHSFTHVEETGHTITLTPSNHVILTEGANTTDIIGIDVDPGNPDAFTETKYTLSGVAGNTVISARDSVHGIRINDEHFAVLHGDNGYLAPYAFNYIAIYRRQPNTAPVLAASIALPSEHLSTGMQQLVDYNSIPLLVGESATGSRGDLSITSLYFNGVDTVDTLYENRIHNFSTRLLPASKAERYPPQLFFPAGEFLVFVGDLVGSASTSQTATMTWVNPFEASNTSSDYSSRQQLVYDAGAGKAINMKMNWVRMGDGLHVVVSLGTYTVAGAVIGDFIMASMKYTADGVTLVQAYDVATPTATLQYDAGNSHVLNVEGDTLITMNETWLPGDIWNERLDIVTMATDGTLSSTVAQDQGQDNWGYYSFHVGDGILYISANVGDLPRWYRTTVSQLTAQSRTEIGQIVGKVNARLYGVNDVTDSHAFALDNLTDVDTTTTPPTEGDVLVYRTNEFVPEALASGGGTLATLDKTFVTNEQSTLTLSSAQANAVVSVAKEVAQTGVTNNNWDVSAQEAAFMDFTDSAYATTLSPSATTGVITLSLGTGNWAADDVNRAVIGNGGIAIITGTSGTGTIDARVIQAFTDTGVIASGDWTMQKSLLHPDQSNNMTTSGFTLNTTSDIGATSEGISYYYGFNDDRTGTLPGTPTSAVIGGCFYNSGNEFLLINTDASSDVYQYSVSIPYDITSTITHLRTTLLPTGGTSRSAPIFYNSGTEFYKIDGDSGTFRPYYYTVSTPYDLSTASYIESRIPSTSAVTGTPRGTTFNNDGTKVITCTEGDGSGQIIFYEWTLSTPYDISSGGVPTTNTISTGHTSDDITSGSFSLDGTGFVGYTYSIGDSVISITFSTAWDISTASAVTKTSNTTAFASNSILSVFHANVDNIIGFDNSLHIGSASRSPALIREVDFSAQLTTNPVSCIAWSADGLNAVVCSALGPMYGYTTSTPFDANTLVYASQSYTPTNTVAVYVGSYNNDGTKFIGFGPWSGSWYSIQFLLSTPYDLSTANTETRTFRNLGGTATNNTLSGIISADGTKVYTVYASGLGTITLGSAWDATSMSHVAATAFPAEIADTAQPRAWFNSDGSKVFIADIGSNVATMRVYQYTMSTPYDFTTLSYDSVSRDLGSINQDSTQYGTDFTSGYVSTDDTELTIATQKTNNDNSNSAAALVVSISDNVNTYYNTNKVTTTTSDIGQIDTTYWTDINSMTSTVDLTTGSMYLSFSTDARTTFWIVQNGLGSRNVVRNNGGTWEYNSNVTYASETWTAATTNSLEISFDEAMDVAQNQMTPSQLDAATDTDFPATGNTLDIAVTNDNGDGTSNPIFDSVIVNYDANTLNQGATLNTDYEYDQPATDKVRVKSLGNYNLKIRVM